MFITIITIYYSSLLVYLKTYYNTSYVIIEKKHDYIDDGWHFNSCEDGCIIVMGYTKLNYLEI